MTHNIVQRSPSSAGCRTIAQACLPRALYLVLPAWLLLLLPLAYRAAQLILSLIRMHYPAAAGAARLSPPIQYLTLSQVYCHPSLLANAQQQSSDREQPTNNIARGQRPDR